MAKVGLSSPWMLFYRKVSAMFEKDPGVRVVFDEESGVIRLYVESGEKAAALEKLLPAEKTFGNVTVKIEVVPANGFVQAKAEQETDAALITAALCGNQAVSFIKPVRLLYNNELTYVVFENRVVQYFTDDLGDYYGLRSTLYEDLARELFGQMDGVFFCTDRPGALVAPLGEWP